MSKKRASPNHNSRKRASINGKLPQPAVIADTVPQHDQETGGQGFSVVAIGASAGGLDAFTRLLQQLPADTGMAIVLIQHLAPRHESMLVPILSRTAKMPVGEIRNQTRVAPNHIYVIPPNTQLSISGGMLMLQPRVEGGERI